MRRFMMHRAVDATGVSGVGHIADGVEFDDGTVVVRWRTSTPGTTMFGSLAHAQAVHGHDGRTTFVFHDAPGPTVWLCCMCFSSMDIPVNHCFQCGGSNTAIPTDATGLRLVQQHDEQRLAAVDTREAELRALREVALAVLGPAALGLTVERSSVDDRTHTSVRVGSAWYHDAPREGETDEEYLGRVGPRCALDPVRVRTGFAARRGVVPLGHGTIDTRARADGPVAQVSVECRRCYADGFVGCQCTRDMPAGRWPG